MDAEVPRTLGNLEDAEPDRRPAGRPNANKKPLDVFLKEFEERLRDHPGEAATSAGAALQGRAEGSWRTPVDGGERAAQHLAVRAPGRRPLAEPGPTAPEPGEPGNPPPPQAASSDFDPVGDAVPPSTRGEPGLEPEAGPPAARPATPGPENHAVAAAAAKKRNRHRRRHHR